MTLATNEPAPADASHGTAHRENDGAHKGVSGGTCLERLFAPWPAIAVEEARLPDSPPGMFPEEAAQVERAVLRRQVEFAAVRACARRAAGRLGMAPFALTNGPDRAPRWPVDLVGALTHTGPAPGGYCAAAVARHTEIVTIGIDAEKAEPLPLRLWAFVLTSSEQLGLSGSDPQRQGLLAKIIFSAKECFYKAQFPLTRGFLGFQQVEVVLDLEAQTFAASLAGGAAPSTLPPFPAGRFAVDGGLVTTAIALPR